MIRSRLSPGAKRPFLMVLAGFLLAACTLEGKPSSDFAHTSKAATQPEIPARFAPLDDALQRTVEDAIVPGLSYVLSQNGSVIATNHFGVQSYKTGTPVSDETLFRVYSMTKPITGVAMMQLYQAGKWQLDDPVTKHIPEFERLEVLTGPDASGNYSRVAMVRPPTMRELMNHSAGFAYGLSGEDPANRAFREGQILGAANLQVFIDQTADIPLLFQPGTNWSYSAAVDIQGYLVEKLSGEPLGEYLKANIFEPLGMKDTMFFVPEEDLHRLAGIYALDPKSQQLMELASPFVDFGAPGNRMESGGGGLVSSLRDYARFCQMLLNGGALDGARVLQPETLALMTRSSLPDGIDIWTNGDLAADESAGRGFGLDFGLILDPEAAGSPQGRGTYYWGGAGGTWFWVDPENDLYFVGMVQRFGMFDLAPNDQPRAASEQIVYESMK
jgi:CubicO group peptidase (beta-lactamase class C family)